MILLHIPGMGGPCQLISEKVGANAEFFEIFKNFVIFVLLGPKYITLTGSEHDSRICYFDAYP